MTFSLTARCPDTGMFGIVISSSSPAVAARCVHLRAHVGAVASQNITDPRLGQIGLDLLGRGLPAKDVLGALVASTPFSEYRQLVVVDSSGETAAHSGSETLGIHATCLGPSSVAAGNLLAREQVPAAMMDRYQAESAMPFADRLLAALEAGLQQGGEAGPVRSAGLYVVSDVSWPIIDLRIDWHDRPIDALKELWTVYQPQVDDYVRRAQRPTEAPSFGVEGDL